MSKNIIVEGVGKLTLGEDDYKASGGQADIYVKESVAYKIYHDPSKMIATRKIEELAAIADKNVLRPQKIIYGAKNAPIGYTMEFKDNASPLCKSFTKKWKETNNVSDEMVNDFLEKMMETIKRIHAAQCLIVDLNEMNVLSSPKFKIPYFIDVDSYQTPSFHADAINESIRDRTVKGNKWTENSDWYSFAILAFQMWIGIHPYRGTHPQHGSSEWAIRMEKGLSVFDKGVTLPSVCRDFSIIPPQFLAWFKYLFQENKRAEPPSFAEIGGILVPVSMPVFQQATTSSAFEVSEIFSHIEAIHSVFNFMGINYLTSASGVFKEKAKLPFDIDLNSKVLLCESGDMSPVVAVLKDGKATFSNEKSETIGTMAANDMMYRNGCIYTVFNGKLTENHFEMFSGKIIHETKYASGVSDNSTEMFDGVVFQNLLGKAHITLPYEKGKVCMMGIPELDGTRILDASSRGNVCVVVAEKAGKYNRYYLAFNKPYSSYTCRVVEDKGYSDVNLMMLNNGACVLALESSCEIFKDSVSRIVEHPPFDSNNKLYNIRGGLVFVSGDKIKSARMK